MLGDWSMADGRIVFTPVISFSRGYSYELLRKSKSLLVFTVPPDELATTPELTGFYPSADTLPENLLKVYLRFSEPMSIGRSLQYATLVRNNKDTLHGTFLDLQPELWNPDRTCLTLWLDPGRIKQGLIPNEVLGELLKKGDSYTVTVSAGWMSKKGKKSTKSFTKTFYAGSRDDKKPDIKAWRISQPRAETKDTLRIDFGESLDFLLIESAVSISDSSGNEVPGEIFIKHNEKTLLFVPKNNWPPGIHSINADAQLEDLSGNNLSRPFDRNLLKDAPPDQRLKFTRSIEIR